MMGEKKLYLYMNDTEYGKRLQRYLNVNRHRGLRVEAVTERDVFWRGRQQGGKQDEYWLTDDIRGAADDRGDPGSLIVLDEADDERRQRVSCRMKAENLFTVLLSTMALEIEAKGDAQAPLKGVYGVYSPWGEEGSVLAALLSQRFAAYGKTLYVNMSEFPIYYIKEMGDDTHLGELFFRIDSPDLANVVTRAKQRYGAAERFPGVSHYRDLWDIGPDDMDRFFKRLECDCGISYTVVLFNDIRGALPMTDMMTELFFTCRKSDISTPFERWRRYAKTEKTEGKIHVVTMPAGWEGWICDMEREEPENWLDDNEKKEFIDGMFDERESP